MEDADDVEYAELVFSNGKSKNKKGKKKKVKIHKSEEDTTYACIDHVKTAQQYKEKQQQAKESQKRSDTPQNPNHSIGDGMTENIPLMDGALESSV